MMAPILGYPPSRALVRSRRALGARAARRLGPYMTIWWAGWAKRSSALLARIGPSKSATHSSTARVFGDDGGGPPVALHEHVVEVARLLSGELPEPEVVEHEEVGGEPPSELALEGIACA